jgi:hypothetical protein
MVKSKNRYTHDWKDIAFQVKEAAVGAVDTAVNSVYLLVRK